MYSPNVMVPVLIIVICALFAVSYFLFKHWKGGISRKRTTIVGVVLGVLALGFYLIDGFRSNLSGIGLVLILIVFLLYRYKTEKTTEGK